jgi:hypothetical protein
MRKHRRTFAAALLAMSLGTVVALADDLSCDGIALGISCNANHNGYTDCHACVDARCNLYCMSGATRATCKSNGYLQCAS